jgi:uncharacterized membrane protein
MAALVYGTDVLPQWFNGAADKAALYAYKDANSGDTINLSQDFIIVLQAVVIDVRAQLQDPCGITGTTLAFPGGLSAGAGWLLVWGE